MCERVGGKEKGGCILGITVVAAVVMPNKAEKTHATGQSMRVDECHQAREQTAPQEGSDEQNTVGLGFGHGEASGEAAKG